MQPYQNRAGTSGISAYEIAAEAVTIQYSDGDVYEYTYASAGQENVERMKELARAGQGLNTFINANVRKRFARKLS